MRRPSSAAAVLLAVALLGIAMPLAGWAADDAATRGVRPVRSLLELRYDKVVPQQWDLSCGAAALATILTYQHGDPVPEREIARGLIRREEYLETPELIRVRQGFSLLDLKRYVERRGYEGIGYGRLTLEDLIDLAPIMVPVGIGGYNHFVIFRGLLADRRAVLADPAWGNRTMPLAEFEDAWLTYPEVGKVGFVVARPDGAEAPGRMAPGPGVVPRAPDAVLRRVVFSARP